MFRRLTRPSTRSSTLICVGLAVSAIAILGRDKTLGDARRQDLKYAREHYVLVSHAFSPAARVQALTLIERLEQRAGIISEAEFLVGIERLSALSHNAHDAVWFGEAAWQPEKRLPIHIIWFPDAMVVARAGPPVLDLVGARIMSVEGLTPDALFKRLADLCGGTEGYRRWNVTWAIESEGILAALGIAKSLDRIRFSLVLADGRQVERAIDMIPSKNVPVLRPARLWSGELSDEEVSRGWRAAIGARGEPLYLRDADEPFRLTVLQSSRTAYLQFRGNRDLGNHSIRSFAQATRAALAAQRPPNLIVDLRFNDGGDITLTRDLMREIPQYATAQVYLFVGRYTFSAGIVAAAIVKYYGNDRVRIVGENVGDRLRWWSEGNDVCLPNSHLCLRITDGLWDLTKGCAAERDCYGDQIVPPVGSLDPDINAPLTAAVWLGGHDPATETIEAQIRKPRN